MKCGPTSIIAKLHSDCFLVNLFFIVSREECSISKFVSDVLIITRISKKSLQTASLRGPFLFAAWIICIVLVLKSKWIFKVVHQSDYNWTATFSVASENILPF